MKIALCFSGMLRTFNYCLPSIIEHIIQANPEHQFDSFIATWDVHGTNPVWWEVSKDNTPVDFNKVYQFKNELGLKKLYVDTFESSDFMKYVNSTLVEGGKYSVRYGETSNPYNFLPMIKKIDQAHQLMIDNRFQTGVNYDIVVRLRTDLFFKEPFKFIEPDVNTIYMPERECWGPKNLNDQMNYGNMDTMNKWCSVYKNIDMIFNNIRSLHPETVFAHWSDVIQANLVKQPINYFIMR